MKYSEAKKGRVFILRLEDGEIIHKELELFAEKFNIKTASVSIVGGINTDSILVVGPEKSRDTTIVPMEHVLNEAYECTGTGTIFPNSSGKPILHLHLAAGRKTNTITGCVRRGVKVWLVLEVIIYELTDTNAMRILDSNTGFELLVP